MQHFKFLSQLFNCPRNSKSVRIRSMKSAKHLKHFMYMLLNMQIRQQLHLHGPLFNFIRICIFFVKRRSMMPAKALTFYLINIKRAGYDLTRLDDDDLQ